MARINRLGSLTGVAVKKQVDFDTAITPDKPLRCKPFNIEQKPNLIKDDACVGQNIDQGHMVGGYNVTGSLEFEGLHPDEFFLLQGVFPDESTISDPTKTFVLVSYTGSNEYERLSLVTTNLLAEKSTDGLSWSDDTDFGTAGTIDISASAYDTIAELVAEIDGTTGFSCVMFGTGTEASTSIPVFAVTQIRNATGRIPLLLKSRIAASTTAKTHQMTIGSTNALPSYTFRANADLGTDKSINYEGCKFSNFSLSLEPQGLLKTTFGIMGKKETTDQTDLSLTLGTLKPMTISNTKMVFIDKNGVIYALSEVKSAGIEVNPSLHDSKSIQTAYIEEPDYQNYEIKNSFSCANNATNMPLRPNWQAADEVRCYLYIGGVQEVDETNHILPTIFFEMPYMTLSNFSSAVSTRDKLFVTGEGMVVKEITVYTVDQELTTY
jgi:hypothetical protein